MSTANACTCSAESPTSATATRPPLALRLESLPWVSGVRTTKVRTLAGPLGEDPPLLLPLPLMLLVAGGPPPPRPPPAARPPRPRPGSSDRPGSGAESLPLLRVTARVSGEGPCRCADRSECAARTGDDTGEISTSSEELLWVSSARPTPRARWLGDTASTFAA